MAAAQPPRLVDVPFGSEALMGTRPTALGGDAALLVISSVTLGEPPTFSEPVFSSEK